MQACSTLSLPRTSRATRVPCCCTLTFLHTGFLEIYLQKYDEAVDEDAVSNDAVNAHILRA